MGIAAFRVAAIAVAAVASFSVARAENIAPTEPVREFSIAAQPLSKALLEFSRQADVIVTVSPDLVSGRTAASLEGKFTSSQALNRLLEGTGLKASRTSSGAITIEAVAAAKPIADKTSLPERSGNESDSPLNEIIVTASLRREPAHEVPMQVNVMSADSLERSGAKTLQDYLANQPGVDVVGGISFATSVAIRGVVAGAGAATVGVYVDNVATGSSSAFAGGTNLPLNMGLLDLNHIEVLRGPQGTLYGAGAVGGVLKYLTNQPDSNDFSGSVRMEGVSIDGGGMGYTANGVLNMPVVPGIAAIRVSALRDHYGGYYDAVGPAGSTNIDQGNTDGGRISALITPIQDLSIRLTATVQDATRGGLTSEDVDPQTGQPIYGQLQHQIYLREPQRYKFALYGLDVEYNLGWARLNAITSSQAVRVNLTEDATNAYGPLLIAAGLPVQTVRTDVSVREDRISQELRLTSPSSDWLEWLAGLYVTHERGNNYGSESAELTGVPTPFSLLATPQISTYDEVAGYGDLTWRVTPALSLTGGLRVAHDRQQYTSAITSIFGPPQANGGPSSATTPTYLATAGYALNSTSNVYVRAASGYRPGGPNGVVPEPPVPLAKPTFQSDSLWSYEVGYKGDLFDRTLSFDAALYDIEWHNIQQQLSAGAFSFHANAGNARVRGAELALNWRPVAAWRINAAASMLDARLLDAPPELGAPPGTRLPDSARFSANLGLTHSFHLVAHAATVGADVRYVGSRDSEFAGTVNEGLPPVELPAYTLVDLRASVEFGKLDIRGYVRNVANRRALLSGTYITTTDLSVMVAQPRTVGIAATYSF